MKPRRGGRSGRRETRERGRALFAAQSCRACHTDADGQTPKGPHLVDIGKRYSPAELVESILKPSAKIAQGYEAYSFAMADGRVVTRLRRERGGLDRSGPRVVGRPARAEAVGHRGAAEAGDVGDAGGDRGEPDARGAGRPRRLPPVAGSRQGDPTGSMTALPLRRQPRRRHSVPSAPRLRIT